MANDQAHLSGPLYRQNVARDQYGGPGQVQRLVRGLPSHQHLVPVRVAKQDGRGGRRGRERPGDVVKLLKSD